jgi:hypothetical protein
VSNFKQDFTYKLQRLSHNLKGPEGFVLTEEGRLGCLTPVYKHKCRLFQKLSNHKKYIKAPYHDLLTSSLICQLLLLQLQDVNRKRGRAPAGRTWGCLTVVDP